MRVIVITSSTVFDIPSIAEGPRKSPFRLWTGAQSNDEDEETAPEDLIAVHDTLARRCLTMHEWSYINSLPIGVNGLKLSCIVFHLKLFHLPT